MYLSNELVLFENEVDNPMNDMNKNDAKSRILIDDEFASALYNKRNHKCATGSPSSRMGRVDPPA